MLSLNLSPGSICLGYAIARYLFPSSIDHETDFIASDLLTHLSENAKYDNNSLFHFQYWLDPAKNGSVFENNDFFSDGPELTRGGRKSQYTRRIQLDCNEVYDLLPKDYTPPFAVEDVVILSNGYCGIDL